ncbi:hypothetical protein [Aquimarina algiphila]|uniref:hypothetical protein n=1 Tax=Aquimarina algiphila TaxID=2047982 RepID=UPI002330D5A7|nr:hypothetical protein [Aquimarina algiphila]
MKKPLHLIKTWFETGDVPTQQQFHDAWDSFHHKDNGEVLVGKTVNDKGDITFVFSDKEELTIEKFIPDVSKPIGYIDGLVEQLTGILDAIDGLQSGKVDTIDGKGLSDTNFSQGEKDKLEGLQNYTPPTSQPVSFIEGLQMIVDELTQDLNLKVNQVDGKGLSDTNFSQEEKDKLANISPDLAVYNLSNTPAFLNYRYFGKKVYGVLLAIPTPELEVNYTFTHALNVEKYLRIELWEDGLPPNNTGQIAREDLAKLIGENAGTFNHTKDIIGTTGYQIPTNKLLYIEYTEFAQGVGADIIGVTPIGG